MIDISNNFPTGRTPELIPAIRINPAQPELLQLARQTKVLVFEHSGGLLYIDFIAYPVLSDTVYIVPAHHFYQLANGNTGHMISIDIDRQQLQPRHKQLLYAIKYNKNKCISAISGIPKETSCFCILEQLAKHETYKQHVAIHILGTWIEQQTNVSLTAANNANYAHLETAERLLHLLEHKTLTTLTCKVNLISTELFCSERNLHRICIKTFRKSAKDVLYYHLAIKAIFMLVQPHYTIGDVAAELAFSSTSVFDRYLKRFSGLKPSAIRSMLNSTCS